MADRLASFKDLQIVLKDGQNITAESDKYAALGAHLDAVSRRMMTYIFKSTAYTLATSTSDGTSSPTEFYGIEHYGTHARNRIRLKRHPVISITSINDNGTLVDASQYVVDYQAGIIYRNVGKFFRQFKAVQVIYTAGYPVTGSGDTQAVQVPLDLKGACVEQVAYEFSKWQPGGVPVGATTISRPDGSLVIKAQPWLDMVEDVMRQYRM